MPSTKLKPGFFKFSQSASLRDKQVSQSAVCFFLVEHPPNPTRRTQVF